MTTMINTNVMSLNAQRNLATNSSSLATTIQRLSSGLRINSAKDDAAGLAISERFTTQIRGLDVAARNANDGISLSQTAEGSMVELGNNLQRIRELAVQSRNATNSASDRAALQAEVKQRIAEIDRIANQTEFNGLKLLDGSFTSQAFQVGANAGQTISVDSIVDARAAALGRFSLVADGTITGNVVLGSTNNGIAAEANLTVTVGSQTSGQISYAANAGADAIASAINTAAGSLGVTATASNSATLGSLSAAGVVSFSINGQAISANVTDTSDLTALAAAINGVSSSSGVTASFTNPSDKSQLTLSTTDGRNIAISTFAVSTTGTQTISFDGATMTEGATATDTAVKTGTIELVSAKQLTVSNANADVFPAAGTNSASFDAVSLIDISSASGADKAIKIVDQALSAINSARADMGAVQNRFMSVIASVQTTSENLSASRSRIRDTDFAKETAELTRTQILVQAGTAMLAQANQAPQNVLSLLR